MSAQPNFYTVRDFEAFTELPENEDRLFEYINGEIVEKVPNNAYASKIAARIIYLISRYLEDNDIEGHVTGEAGGFKVGGDRYAPDVAYLSADKQEEVEKKGYNSIPPDLAVEVETNTTNATERRLRRKTFTYLNNGVVVWVIYPETQEVEVYTPDGVIQRLGIEDTLEGGTVLPGFTIQVKEIFKTSKKK
jgi:Uma2 family endonuclease